MVLNCSTDKRDNKRVMYYVPLKPLPVPRNGPLLRIKFLIILMHNTLLFGSAASQFPRKSVKLIIHKLSVNQGRGERKIARHRLVNELGSKGRTFVSFLACSGWFHLWNYLPRGNRRAHARSMGPVCVYGSSCRITCIQWLRNRTIKRLRPFCLFMISRPGARLKTKEWTSRNWHILRYIPWQPFHPSVPGSR